MSGTVFENIPKEELATLAKASEFSMWPKKYRGTSMLKFFAEVRDWDYAKWLLEENVFKGDDGDLFRSVGRIFKSRQELFSDPEKLYEAVGRTVVVKEPEIVVSEDSGLLAIEVPYEPKLTDWVKAVPASFDKASKRWYAAKSSAVKSYLKSASSFPKGYAPKIKWETDVDLSTKKPSFSGLKMKPYPYQEDGIRFLMSGNVVLADDMGMGKTLQTIGAVVASGAKTVMVACPSVVARNWKAEFMKATGKFHDDEIVVMDDGAEGREIVLSGLPRRKKIVLIYSYDALRRDIEHESFKDCVFDLVVADEAHMVGSESNQRRKALTKVRGDWRIALSGTPFSWNGENLWGILNFLHPKAYPSYFQFCQNLFWKGHFGGWGRLREDRLETFRRIVESHVKMRLKKDYLKDELPMKNPDETVVLELPQDKMEAYRKIVSDGYETISEFLTVRSEFETAFGKPVIGKDKAEQEFARGVAERLGLERILRMDAVTSPAFYVLNRLRTFLATEAAGPKLAYVRELAAKRVAEGKNLIVLTSYLETVNLIQKELEGVAETLRITGSVSGKKRTEVVTDFQSRRWVVLVATTMSVGVGVTLTNSDALVFFDEVFDDKFMLQASDRIYRIGQKDTVTVSTLTYRWTVDEFVRGIIWEKKALFERGMNLSKREVSFRDKFVRFLKNSSV